MNKRSIGSSYEDRACEHIRSQGVNIIERNYSVKYGEIDIIGQDGADLVFFEVKFRSSSDKGYASEAVNPRKQYKICRVSDFYIMTEHVPPDTQIRYDVIAIDGENIEWIKNAFDYVSHDR